MSTTTRLRILNVCSWGGIVALAITLVGWLIAGLLPLPLGPSDSMSTVAHFYGTHGTRRELGFMLGTLGVCFLMPLVGVITVHMARSEGRLPLLAVIQLGTGSVTMLINLLPSMLFCVLAFRGDRDPHTTMLLNDLTWLIFFTPIVPFIFQNLAIATSVLASDRPPFPRWVGYLNAWVALAFVPDVLAYFFHSGVFAWNGIFVFWLALGAYSVFLVAMSIVTLRANAALVAALEAEA